MTSKKITGFKGFNEHLQCSPNGKVFQYEVGKTYTHEGAAKICESGFHFCTNPMDVLGYYPPTGRFAEVEGEVCDAQTYGDTKRSAKRLTIKAELSLSHFLGAGVKFILDRVEWKNAPATNTGNQSAATNTGYQSAATNTGDQSAATNTGDRSAATNTGNRGCAISLGIEGKAKGSVGCWLTIAEWKEDKKYVWHRIDVQTVRVDGKDIKSDTFYLLSGGKFVEEK